MVAKRTRLGRGLDSLVSSPHTDEQALETPARGGQQAQSEPGTHADDTDRPSVGRGAPVDTEAPGSPIVRTLPIEDLRPNPFQPRDTIDPQRVAGLARSIAASGIIQPIVARSTPHGPEIITGERRWRAARAAGLNTVPVIIRQANDEQMLEWALIENIHREDLNAVERAQAYKRYLDAFTLTTDDLAQRLGEDRSTVTNYVRLLELPEPVRRLLADGRISMGHARALLGLSDDSRRAELAATAAKKPLSVRALEQWVRRERAPRRENRPGGPQATASHLHIRDLERRFSERLGTKVSIMLGKQKGAGRVVIEFYNVDDFERICAEIGLADES